MTIHGITIKMPHSGFCTRSVVTTIMVQAMQAEDANKTRKDLKEFCQRSMFNTFIMQDVNYCKFGDFHYIPEA